MRVVLVPACTISASRGEKNGLETLPNLSMRPPSTIRNGSQEYFVLDVRCLLQVRFAGCRRRRVRSNVYAGARCRRS